MSKAKFALLFVIFSLLLACAASRPALAPAARPPAAGPPALAEAFFQQGKTCLEKGDMDAARACFNQTLDALLDLPEAGQGGDGKTVLSDYVKRIADIELIYLKDKNSP